MQIVVNMLIHVAVGRQCGRKKLHMVKPSFKRDGGSQHLSKIAGLEQAILSSAPPSCAFSKDTPSTLKSSSSQITANFECVCFMDVYVIQKLL